MQGDPSVDTLRTGHPEHGPELAPLCRCGSHSREAMWPAEGRTGSCALSRVASSARRPEGHSRNDRKAQGPTDMRQAQDMRSPGAAGWAAGGGGAERRPGPLPWY